MTTSAALSALRSSGFSVTEGRTWTGPAYFVRKDGRLIDCFTPDTLCRCAARIISGEID